MRGNKCWGEEKRKRKNIRTHISAWICTNNPRHISQKNPSCYPATRPVRPHSPPHLPRSAPRPQQCGKHNIRRFYHPLVHAKVTSPPTTPTRPTPAQIPVRRRSKHEIQGGKYRNNIHRQTVVLPEGGGRPAYGATRALRPCENNKITGRWQREKRCESG